MVINFRFNAESSHVQMLLAALPQAGRAHASALRLHQLLSAMLWRKVCQCLLHCCSIDA